MQTMWSFSYGRFTLVAEIEPSQDLDLSWDEDGEVAENLDNGTYLAFDTRVSVWFKGVMIAQDWLCQSIYADPEEFFTSHRDPDPMNRNCSIMRAAKGENVAICHYFPSMVHEAVSMARAWVAA